MVSTGHVPRTLVSRTVARARRVLTHVLQSIAETRLNRMRLESELYRGGYRIRSKSDDDLPIAS
jgi:hypothetical protein